MHRFLLLLNMEEAVTVEAAVAVSTAGDHTAGAEASTVAAIPVAIMAVNGEGHTGDRPPACAEARRGARAALRIPVQRGRGHGRVEAALAMPHPDGTRFRAAVTV
ncbi:MAG TPA: hypothetical protein VGM18_02440 [Candidatus Sulfotelmatobacter sp.]